ncbi:unnamed protein product, partial [Mesorhabditis belari]|uniref:Uncharacterized protein n=1 Tax=Mesorhabditis belari TaxID=2138241 RepID=A0AAF3FPY0_9BILA
MDSVMQVTRPVIGWGIIFFNIFGVLLTMTTFFQSVCLLFEFIQAYCMFFTTMITRRLCVTVQSPYLFTICMQQFLLLLLSIDLVISSLAPAFHRRTPTKIYCLLMALPAVIFSSWMEALAIRGIDDEILWICNPPIAFAPEPRKVWLRGCVWINVITFALYMFLLIKFHVQAYQKKTAQQDICLAENRLKHQCYEEKVTRSLSVLVISFVFSWFFALIGADVVQFLGLSAELVPVFQTYMVFPAMLSYSLPYYVLFVNSAHFREIFTLQLKLLFRIPMAAKEREESLTRPGESRSRF